MSKRAYPGAVVRVRVVGEEEVVTLVERGGPQGSWWCLLADGRRAWVFPREIIAILEEHTA